MFSHNTLRYVFLVMLSGGALFQAFAAEYFGLEILTEILILAMLVHAPWITLTMMGLLYTALIPVSYRLYKSREKRGHK